MIKADEKALLVALYLQGSVPEAKRKSARALVKEMGMCEQRAYFLFCKWTSKDLYEWGVSADLGWLTEKGNVVAAEWLLEGY